MVIDCYFLVRLFSRLALKVAFRQVTVIGGERIPLYGPVIFVGNHNNQFVDVLPLVARIPRRLRFLVAAPSMNLRLMGALARLANSIPVKRPRDVMAQGLGRLKWEENSTTVTGVDTHFNLEMKGGDRLSIDLSTGPHIVMIVAILSNTEATIESPIIDVCPPEGVIFNVQPKIDHANVYEAVVTQLKDGDCIAIFPEGGSHDQPDLLPLKPGVALMAMLAVLDGADDVLISPLGIDYDRPESFKSQCTVYCGEPICISRKHAIEYQKDPKGTISKVLGLVADEMRNSVVKAKDRETLQDIRLCVSLFPPERVGIGKDASRELAHRISRIFRECENVKSLVALRQQLAHYTTLLGSYGIDDGDMWMLKQSAKGASLLMLEIAMQALIHFCLFASTALLWGPMGAFIKRGAEKHREKALLSSSVKLTANDVVASYKLLTMLAFVPTLNFLYGSIFSLLFCDTWQQSIAVIVICLSILPALYDISLESYEVLPLHWRRLNYLGRTLVGKVNVWRETEEELCLHRSSVQLCVRNVIHELAPQVSSTLLSEIHSYFPKVIMDIDTQRLSERQHNWVPTHKGHAFDSRQEIF